MRLGLRPAVPVSSGVAEPILATAGPVAVEAWNLLLDQVAVSSTSDFSSFGRSSRGLVGTDSKRSARRSAVLIGEGVYGLTRISEGTSPVYWWLQIVVGAAIAAQLPRRRGVRGRAAAFGPMVTVGGALALYYFYVFVL